LIGGPNRRKVIHSKFQQVHRITGSNRVSADRGLWMNLWKLWIAAELLSLPDKRRLGDTAVASASAAVPA